MIDELFNFKHGKGLLDIETLCRVEVSQFYGIEIDEAAAHIARVALYITDHQLNLEAAARFGNTRATVPLIHTPHIVCANALRTDWTTVLPANRCSYIISNPPFIGKKEQTIEQKRELMAIMNGVKGAGVLDYVSCWYVIASNYMAENNKIKVAFVSTNSITQGEQVGVLWSAMSAKNITIVFAHRTFRWTNEGKGVAAVHCVIVGFTVGDDGKDKRLYDYNGNIEGEGEAFTVKQINSYLVAAPNVLLERRSAPICNVPAMCYGSMPIDCNYLQITEEERATLVGECADNGELIRSYIGGDEFINSIKRYCLWLVNADTKLVKRSKFIMQRIESVRKFRLESNREATNKLADYAMLFGEIRQPGSKYLAVPKVSSENRNYIPIGFVEADVIASGSLLIVPNATWYEFSVLQSAMHMAWMRAVCGRLESRYQYSAGIVYNNYVWPKAPTASELAAVKCAANEIIDVRKRNDKATLAELYDRLRMPPELVKAHEANNRAVDRAYGYKGGNDDASRVAFLFKLHEEMTSLLATEDSKKRTKKL